MKRFFLLAFAIMFVPGIALCAADAWVQIFSSTNVYETRIPENHKITTTQFMFMNGRALQSEEIAAIIDQRPFKNVTKNYIVKFDQTFGPAFSAEEIAQLLERDYRNYTDYYAEMEGVVRDKIEVVTPSYTGGEIMISYRDPSFGIQSIRARILYNNNTRLQQIVVGPENIMKSFQTRDFFESLKFQSLLAKVDKKITESWKPLESPTGMFTVLYPGALAPPYYMTDPVSKWDTKSEIVSFIFQDPARNQKIFYNVYGYQLGSELNFASVQEVLIKRHVTKHRNTADGVTFSKGISQGADEKSKIPYMEATYPIKPLAGFPYIKMVKLRTFFSGKNMVVEEILASGLMMETPFAETLLGTVKFHPGKMHAPVQPVLYQPPPEPAPEAATGNAAPAANTEATPATAAPPAAPATPAPPSPASAQ